MGSLRTQVYPRQTLTKRKNVEIILISPFLCPIVCVHSGLTLVPIRRPMLLTVSIFLSSPITVCESRTKMKTIQNVLYLAQSSHTSLSVHTTVRLSLRAILLLFNHAVRFHQRVAVACANSVSRLAESALHYKTPSHLPWPPAIARKRTKNARNGPSKR